MPDTVPIVTDIGANAPTATTKPPRKRAKRSKVTPPASDKPARKKAVTLLARIKAMGEYHVDAYRLLATAEFDAALRAEMNHTTTLALARARCKRADAEAAAANQALDDVTHSQFADGDARKTLDELASHIAEARAEIPDADVPPPGLSSDALRDFHS